MSDDMQSEPIFKAVLSTSHLLCQEWRIYDQLFSEKENFDFLETIARDFFRVANESIYCMIQLRLCKLSDPKVDSRGNKNISLCSLLEEIQGENASDIQKIESLIGKFLTSCKPIKMVRNKLIAHTDGMHYRDNPFYVSRKRIRVCVKRLENVMNEIASQRGHLLIYDDPLRGDGKHLLKVLKMCAPFCVQKYLTATDSFSGLSEQEQEVCIKLIVSGGAVERKFVEDLLPLAKTLVLSRLCEDNSIVGIGAIKKLRASYARKIAGDSQYSFDENTPEMGYVAVDPEHQGKGLSHEILQQLCAGERGGLFATTSNDRMKKILHSHGFQKRGQSWGDNRLTLWIKEAISVS